MSKTWIAKCVSFKGKHPDGEVTHRVVVKAQYKKDGVELAKEELKLFDADHHDKYKVPVLTEIENEEEAEKHYIDYLAVREQLSQLEITEHESASNEVKKAEAPETLSLIINAVKEHDQCAEITEEEKTTLVNEVIGHFFNITSELKKENKKIDWENTADLIKQRLCVTDLADYDACLSLVNSAAETALPPVAETEEELEEAEELTATIATVAEYPLVESYAVRLSIAKNNESFVHSMTLINTTNGASLVGQPDVFNPKPFSNIENAVVYGLAMAIDAVNKYLVDFIDARQVEKCSDILSGYAQDAEGNFMERYTGDHDLSNAQFMAEPKKKETPPAEEEAKESEANTVGRTILKSLKNAASKDHQITKRELEQMVKNLRDIHVNFIDEFGADFLQGHSMAKIEAAKWTSVSDAIEWFMDKQNLCALYRKEWLCVNPKREENNKPLEEEPALHYYAGQQWRHYVKEIMAQFEPPLLDEREIDLAAQNVAHVFNDWKVALFAEKDNYTNDAEFFKDEVYLAFNNREHEKALELLKSYDRTQAALCEVLALAYDEFVENLPNQKVAEEIKNLVSRLLVDETMGCTYNCETIQALIYSELTANPVNDSTITNPTLKMQWWANLSADFAKQQEARLNPKSGDYMMLAGSTEEINAQIEEIKAQKDEPKAPESEQEPENAQQNTPDFEVEISPLNVSYHGDELDQVMAERVEEITQKSEEYEQEACVHGDGVTAEKAVDVMPYGEMLVDGHLSEFLPAHQIVMAKMVKNFNGTHALYSKEDYEKAAKDLSQAFDRVEQTHGKLNRTQTAEKLIAGGYGVCGANGEGLPTVNDLIESVIVCAVYEESEASQPTRTPAEALQGAASAMANLGKAIGTLPEEIAEPEITPDPMPAQEFYGDKLLSGELDAPYQLAIAFMLKDHGAENYYNESEYQLAACYLEEVITELKEELPALEPGLTVESMVKNKAWDADTIEESLLDKELIKNAAYECAVFDYDNDVLNFNHQQEAPTDEPETTRQDNEPLNDEPVAGPGDDAPVNADVEQPKHVTMRQLHKLQMRAANNHLGALGLGWGYEVKHHWSEGETKNCEVAIWFRDKNGTESKPMSFFGSANTTQTGDAINDAMTMALINGLDSILFSLGIEVEG